MNYTSISFIYDITAGGKVFEVYIEYSIIIQTLKDLSFTEHVK